LNRQYADAETTLSFAAVLEPANADIAFHNGMTLLRNDKPGGALQELKRARSLKLDSALLPELESAIHELEKMQLAGAK
jgi:hypothetical protein